MLGASRLRVSKVRVVAAVGLAGMMLVGMDCNNARCTSSTMTLRISQRKKGERVAGMGVRSNARQCLSWLPIV